MSAISREAALDAMALWEEAAEMRQGALAPIFQRYGTATVRERVLDLAPHAVAAWDEFRRTFHECDAPMAFDFEFCPAFLLAWARADFDAAKIDKASLFAERAASAALLFLYVQPCASDPDDTEGAEPGDEMICAALPADATFWGVYRKRGDGTSTHIIDVSSYAEALEWAEKITAAESPGLGPVMVRLPEYTGSESCRYVPAEGFKP